MLSEARLPPGLSVPLDFTFLLDRTVVNYIVRSFAL